MHLDRACVKRRRVLVAWVAVGIALAVSALWARWWLLRKPLPLINGTLATPGIQHQVEILRDIHGVPHVFASSVEDAAFGQGFVHAQDRLWQMELNRRVGSGRLSEIFGRRALPADRFLRRLGLRRAAQREAQQLELRERALLEAYSRGVNAAMQSIGKRLPLELRILRARPEPWDPVDSLLWAKVMALSLSTNFESELFRARLVEKVGDRRAAELEMRYPRGHPFIVPSMKRGDALSTDDRNLCQSQTAAAAVRELSTLYEQLKGFLPMGTLGASNSWVVAGRRSASGLPLLANDPHLVLQLPSIWYEAHLAAPGLDVYGCTLAGIPGVVLGHNRKVAWGFTNSGVDIQDLFIERLNERGEYEFRGEWLVPQRITEVIRVKGEPDVAEEVLITPHGPLLSGNPALPGTALALRWAALDPGHMSSSLLAMNQAADAGAFREALRDWHTPSQNVVFADVNGNIGYVMAGAVPIRARGSGFGPVPGWSGEFEWIGWLSFEQLPQLWNPETGLIVTANNAVVDRTYPWHLSWDWMNGFRAQRIEQLLCTRPVHSAEDFQKIQVDVHCIPGKLFADRCRNLNPQSSIERQALELLLAWNGEASPDSAAASIYETMILATVRRVLEPELGPELMFEMLGKSATPIAPLNLMLGRYTGFLLEALVDRESSLLPAGVSSWDPILSSALGDAVRFLSETLGPNPARWRWGRLHRLKLNHPLGSVRPLNLIFNGPEVPVGGDSDTPFQSAVVPQRPFGSTAWAPSWRQIVDLSAIDRAVSIYPGGQSGHPGSRHYLDYFSRWYEGQYHPQWMDRDEVEKHLEGRLRLEPVPRRPQSGRRNYI